MGDEWKCWQCGVTLSDLILPVSRRESCRQCGAEIHSCRMCRSYDSHVAGQCREDRAEPPSHRELANFCDYFAPKPDAFQPDAGAGQAQAEAKLAELFGHAPATSSADDSTQALRDLFDLDTDS